MAAIIQAKDLAYQYPRRKKQVLKGLSFSIEEGDFVAIMGRNGAGKTTLCQTLNGVIPHLQGGRFWGQVWVDGLDTQTAQVADLAQRIGMVLEDPEAQLFTSRVDDEMAFAIENLRLPRQKIQERIAWAAQLVRLEEKMDKEPTMLSGGQKQRLAIASVLAMRPKIMVLDEPTSQLDPLGTDQVFSVIRRLKEEEKMTIILASHKSEHIAKYADKIMVLDEGRLLAYDSPQAVFGQADLMDRAAIRPPQVALLANYLKKEGLDLGAEDYPILLEEAQQILSRLLEVDHD